MERRSLDRARALRSCLGLAVMASAPAPALLAGGEPVVAVAVVYDHPDSLDEDDMCFWVHPLDPALSTVIVSDKFAGKLFVYELGGAALQVLDAPSPRNVDTRYGVPFQGTCIDVVALSDRTEDIIRVYRIDPATRTLERIDDGQIFTQDNYGFTLYQHHDGRLWGLTGDRDTGLMRQFALFENCLGQMSGYETSWTFQETRVEGVVADDEAGYYFLAEENVGIWRVGVFDHTDRTLIARIGDASGLAGDIEGLALYHAGNDEGYLIASSQGENKFTVIDRRPPHQARGNFRVEGVRATDGIDVLNVNLGSRYPQGIFCVHNGGSNCCSVSGVKWEDIASALGLAVDTSRWSPRIPCAPLEDAVVFAGAQGGGSVGASAVATDEAVPAAAGDLYVATLATRGGAVSAQSVSGLGLDWTLLAAQCTGRGLSRLETWTAQGTPLGDGPVSASLSGVPQSATLVVSRYSNVRWAPIRNLVSGNASGRDGTCAGGIDADRYALGLRTALRGSFVYGAATMRHRTHAPGERYRERVERSTGTGSGVSSVAAVDRLVTEPGTIALVGSFSGAEDWAALAFEILPATPFFDEYGPGPIRLSGAGIPRSGGSAIVLAASGASAGSAGLLAVARSPADVAFGALHLYVAPPFLLRLPLAFDDQGRSALSAAIPPGFPRSVLYLQALAFGAQLEHSNGLELTTLPEPGPHVRKGP